MTRGYFTPSLRTAAIFHKAQEGLCFHCQAPLAQIPYNPTTPPPPSHQGLPYTIDHVIPRSLGGDPGPNNCVLSCNPCNNTKNASPPTLATLTRLVALLAIRRPLIAQVYGGHILSIQESLRAKRFHRRPTSPQDVALLSAPLRWQRIIKNLEAQYRQESSTPQKPRGPTAPPTAPQEPTS